MPEDNDKHYKSYQKHLFDVRSLAVAGEEHLRDQKKEKYVFWSMRQFNKTFDKIRKWVRNCFYTQQRTNKNIKREEMKGHHEFKVSYYKERKQCRDTQRCFCFSLQT